MLLFAGGETIFKKLFILTGECMLFRIRSKEVQDVDG